MAQDECVASDGRGEKSVGRRAVLHGSFVQKHSFVTVHDCVRDSSVGPIKRITSYM